MAGLCDVRKIGSGNIGATNVLRTGNKLLAAATLLLDGGKGAAAVLIARSVAPDLALVAAVGAVLGHLFPVWIGFRGGKGVATTLGTLLALAWPVGLLACLTRSEEHTSELQSLMRISYAVFCLKKKKTHN